MNSPGRVSTRRLKVVFSEAIAADTFESFVEILELFGHVYRTTGRTFVVQCDPSRSTDLGLQLDDWQRQGAVRSWTDALGSES